MIQLAGVAVPLVVAGATFAGGVGEAHVVESSLAALRAAHEVARIRTSSFGYTGRTKDAVGLKQRESHAATLTRNAGFA